MPTGYTSDIYDGKPVTFADFALGCARAFGATILMRDDDPTVEISDDRILDMSTYHEETIVRAQVRLKQLDGMTLEQKADAAEAFNRERYESYVVHQGRMDDLRDRYELMLVDVVDWTPPTPEHEDFKQFMIQQLNSAIKGDCYVAVEPESVGLAEWEAQQRERAEREIEYHTEEIEKQRERNVTRLYWIQALRESLERESVLS